MSVTDVDLVVRGPRIGVDVGTVRVGLATSDPDGLVVEEDTLSESDGERVEEWARELVMRRRRG